MASGYFRALHIQITRNGKTEVLEDLEQVLDKNGQWVDARPRAKKVSAKVLPTNKKKGRSK